MRWLILLGLFCVGCSNTLETGYEPRRLGANDSARRGYYAAPFTPGAQAGNKADQPQQAPQMGKTQGSY